MGRFRLPLRPVALLLLVVATSNVTSFQQNFKARNTILSTTLCTSRTLCDQKHNGVSLIVRGMSTGEDEQHGDEDSPFSKISSVFGISAQPVVWTSLYYVKTTGAGLPAGPFGLVGALEGVSYLVMVGLVGSSIYRNVTSSSDTANKAAIGEKLSYVSLIAGLIILASLVADQGCVPNAKPILDYSNYLPICDATPGLFGG
jgi:hypothetical protein